MAPRLDGVSTLTSLLERHGDQIAADWAETVQQLGGSRYRTLAAAELRRSANHCLHSFAGVLTSGSYSALDNYLADTSSARLAQGFDIGEVVEGFMLLRESVIPFLWKSFSPGSPDAYEMLVRLDGCVRYMIRRFSHMYAEAMHRHLQDQQALIAKQLAESEGLRRVTTALLEKLELEEVLDIVCTEARQLTRAGGSSVFLLEDSHWLRVAFICGVAPPSLDRIPMDGSIVEEVVRTGQLFLRNDLGPEEWKPYPWSVDVYSLLVVPLAVEGRIIGALDVVNKDEGFFEEDVRFVRSLADQAAIAIEHARLYQQAEQLAVVEERQRLARELHDSVTQSLYSLSLFAEAASGLLSEGQIGRVEDHLRQLRDTAQEALREMRLLIFELHPVELKRSGLIAALQARLEAVETRGGLRAKLTVEGSGRLPPRMEEELYRIAQEALNNVLKHARAKEVTLRLRFGVDAVVLEVSDDGVGFDPAAPRGPGGLGLVGMQQRVQRLGAKMELKSAPGRGTTVKVTMENGRTGARDGQE